MSMTALTAEEQTLIFKARAAIDAYARAKETGDGGRLVKSRRALELVRSELEMLKADDPATVALGLCRKALERPIDAITGLPIDRVAKGATQKAIDHRGDRFDKLQRAGALAK